MSTRPSALQQRLMTCMRDGNTRIRLLISGQRNYRASLDDPALPSYARSVPMSTLHAMRYRCWVQVESERSAPGGHYLYFKLSAIGREVLGSK